ncbi:MAG: hypothetical protein LBF34_01065 [Puniceicoccales bacterium]|jgi:opacity protein-like surface antigen|nr:hypothetical protein [Puniceicoccales bacterium]
MNKLLTIASGLLAAGNVFAEFSAPALHIDAKVEFNTADVYEGRRRLDQNFAPNLELGLPILDDAGKLYVGVGASLSVRHKSFGSNEVAPYVGFSYDITDMFTVDLGYTLHSFDKKPVVGFQGIDESSYFNAPFFVLNADGQVNLVTLQESVRAEGTAEPGDFSMSVAQMVIARAREENVQINPDNIGRLSSYAIENLKGFEVAYTLEGKKRFHEIYAGIMADVLLNPALYFAYDFTQRKANIDGTVHYTFDLSSCGVTGFAIDLGGKVGYTRVKKPYGIAHDTKVSFLDMRGLIATEAEVNIPHREGNLFEKTSWFYAGVNADLVYSLNENAKARAGVAFSFNSAKKDSWINEKNHKKRNVWFSSAVEFTF